jgi:hypothetical protein
MPFGGQSLAFVTISERGQSKWGDQQELLKWTGWLSVCVAHQAICIQDEEEESATSEQ